jgi:membrane protease subunit HflC
MKSNPLFSAGVVLLALLVLGLFLVLMTAYTVRATDCVVVLRWEKPMKEFIGSKDAGLQWKAPYPIDKIERYDARTHVFSTKFEETLTQDGHNLMGTVSAGWRIGEPMKFREKVGTMEKAEDFLSGLVRTYKNAVIGKHPLSHMVSVDPTTLRFDEMESEMLSNVGREAQERYGIKVEFTKIKQLGLPKKVTEKVFERMKKERERLAVAIEEKGKAEADKIKAQADADKEKMLSDARGKAKKLRGDGDAKAAEHYAVFAENEDLAIFLRKLEALENSLEKRATVILTTEDEPYDLLQQEEKGKRK